jgi:hypothetical protein
MALGVGAVSSKHHNWRLGAFLVASLLLATAGCGAHAAQLGLASAPETASTTTTLPSTVLPQLPSVEVASSSSPILTAEYRAAVANVGDTQVGVALTAGAETRVVSAQIAGSVSDLYLHLKLPDSSQWDVEWASGLNQRFVTLAVLSKGVLDIGLAGRSASGLSGALPAQLAQTLASRSVLAGNVQLCTLVHRQDSRSISVIRAVSGMADAPSPPVPLEVTAINGAYQLGWPTGLAGDYDQNGEVNIADITPLGVCLGAVEPAGLGWTLDVQARADGDANGAVNLADLTALGKHYGQRLTGFVVEQSLGNASGPGTDWTPVGTNIAPALNDRNGNPVAALGPSRWQTATLPAESGWAYFRATQVTTGAQPQPPGTAVLAPDLVPPAWPNGAQLAVASVDAREFTFATDAQDDRGGAVDYSFDIATGDAAGPTRTVLTVDKTNACNPDDTHTTVTSPFQPVRAFIHDQTSGSFIPLIEGQQYWVRVGITDQNGNLAYSAWVSYIPSTNAAGGNIDPPGLPTTAWQTWVNRQGDVRCTPPPCRYFGADLQETLYTLVLPAGQVPAGVNPGLLTFDDFVADGAQAHPYTGGEIQFPALLHSGEWVYLGCSVTDSQNRSAWQTTRIAFPQAWILPLPNGNQVTVASQPEYLPNGTTAFYTQFKSRDGTITDASWVEFSGTSYSASTSDGFLLYGAPPTPVPGTADLLTYIIFPGPERVSWFLPHQGLVGLVTLPADQFYSDFPQSHAVESWQAIDAKTALGAYGTLVSDPDTGKPSVQVWEAHPDGTYKVNRYLPNDILTSQSTIIALHVLDGHCLIEYYPHGEIEQIPRCCALRDDGTWLDFPDLAPPANVNPAWTNAQIVGASFAWPDSYFLVTGQDTHTGQYCSALFKGNALQGFDSFSQVWASDSNGVVDPVYPQFNGAPYQDGITPLFVPGHPGEVLANGGAGYGVTAWIGTDGKIRGIMRRDEDDLDGPVLLQRYWQDGRPLPEFAQARMSPDRQWVSPIDVSSPSFKTDPLIVSGVGIISTN